MKGTAAPTLIIDEIGLTTFDHDVARLKIAEEEVLVVGSKQVIGQVVKVFFQGLLVKTHPGEHQEVVFEIVQIPKHGLFVEGGLGIAVLVAQVLPPNDLQAG